MLIVSKLGTKDPLGTSTEKPEELMITHTIITTGGSEFKAILTYLQG